MATKKQKSKNKKTTNWLKSSSSKKTMVLFVLAFAVFGGSYLLWKSFAATSTLTYQNFRPADSSGYTFPTDNGSTVMQINSTNGTSKISLFTASLAAGSYKICAKARVSSTAAVSGSLLVYDYNGTKVNNIYSPKVNFVNKQTSSTYNATFACVNVTHTSKNPGLELTLTNTSTTGALRLQSITITSLAAPAPGATTACVSRPQPVQWHHVVLIMFENHDFNQVIGSGTGADYINGLWRRCGGSTPNTSNKNSWHDSNYYVNGSNAGAYDSAPSYALLTNGHPADGNSTFPNSTGINDDPCVENRDCIPNSVHNLYEKLQLSGKTFKDYFDASPSGCNTSFSGDYHDAVRYYSNLGGQSCSAHDVTLNTFMTDVNGGNLPAFSMILPTNDENMHNNSVADGDNWLQNFLPNLLNSNQYKSGDTAIYFLFDEGDGEGTPVPNVLIAPSVSYSSTNQQCVAVPAGNPIGHYSFVRTTEQMLGLSGITGGYETSAPSLLGYFIGGALSHTTNC